MTPAFPAHIQRPEWVAPLSDVVRFCLSVQTLLETPYQEHGEAVMERIGELTMLYPSSCSALASATWHRDSLLRDTYEDMLRKARDNDETAIRAFKTPSVIKDLANTRCAELNALLVWCERSNSQ
jgi:hypothetical protein